MSNKELNYAEAIAEVEKIVGHLRSGELSVDELSSSVARATELIALCRSRLTATEVEVENLIKGESLNNEQ
ncbi:MAG: exodeoxyribonuclease VII small subunit [Alistipes sp.]|nr:exodeoxyribonuclease VII small subunit [Alistipes sp.]